MIRRIINIDADKCNGCGLCAAACHEGAITMREGKAVLMRDDYCDGLGDCLPACPTGAITFKEREAAPYDAAAVAVHIAARNGATSARHHAAPAQPHTPDLPCGCPGSAAKTIRREAAAPVRGAAAAIPCAGSGPQSELAQWPVQIKLVPVKAPFWEGAHLLVAADCAAYAYAGFHQQFMAGRVTVIGCPKLDEGDYAEKLAEILRQNNIQSVTVARMEVPCCGGIENAVRRAIEASGKAVPLSVVTLGTGGEIVASQSSLAG